MYVPDVFAETDVAAAHSLVAAYPLATVVTTTAQGMEATHVPLFVRPSASPFGTLLGHVRRANRMWQSYTPDTEVLAVFLGPNSYVTPSWYPTKAETGKAVPTWNYAAVHAYGTMRIVEDPEWLHRQVTALTELNEAGRPEPWAVTDAPADYVTTMLKGIVGLEIAVTRWQGQWKVSQNQPPCNRMGVAAGLATDEAPHAREMADLVKRRLEGG